MRSQHLIYSEDDGEAEDTLGLVLRPLISSPSICRILIDKLFFLFKSGALIKVKRLDLVMISLLYTLSCPSPSTYHAFFISSVLLSAKPLEAVILLFSQNTFYSRGIYILLCPYSPLFTIHVVSKLIHKVYFEYLLFFI